jgi:hypothetical protein
MERVGTPPGYPKVIQQKILSGMLDEANSRGARTRLLRFTPGVFTTVSLCTNTGKRFFWFQAIWSSVMTPTATAASPFRRTHTPAGRPALIMAHSSQTAAACCSRSTTSPGLTDTYITKGSAMSAIGT